MIEVGDRVSHQGSADHAVVEPVTADRQGQSERIRSGARAGGVELIDDRGQRRGVGRSSGAWLGKGEFQSQLLQQLVRLLRRTDVFVLHDGDRRLATGGWGTRLAEQGWPKGLGKVDGIAAVQPARKVILAPFPGGCWQSLFGTPPAPGRTIHIIRPDRHCAGGRNCPAGDRELGFVYENAVAEPLPPSVLYRLQPRRFSV